MNMLLFEMRRSLTELDLGLKGDLSISEPMEVRISPHLPAPPRLSGAGHQGHGGAAQA